MSSQTASEQVAILNQHSDNIRTPGEELLTASSRVRLSLSAGQNTTDMRTEDF
jgi:hypothetical protein